MADSDGRDDFDKRIDGELDAYFSERVLGRQPSSARNRDPQYGSVSTPPEPDFSSTTPEDPSLDRAVDSLFMGSFESMKSSASVTSGDDETDRAIDLAVDTLFVEEPEAPPPETAELEASVVQSHTRELDQPGTDLPEEDGGPGGLGQEAYADQQGLAEEKPQRVPGEASFDHGPAEGIELYPEAFLEPKPGERAPSAPLPRAHRASEAAPPREAEDSRAVGNLRQLQEAILTLEWEISRRSVTTLDKELRRLRSRFRDDVTVDFAALAMRVVLDYIVKRMSEAHPESIRFLLEVTSLVRSTAASTRKDPLGTFHRILTRYEKYKSVVRKAEGIPNGKPSMVPDLEIKDPRAFAKMVTRQAKALAMAGQSLAGRIDSSEDPETLIRSFRFLVTRSLNRMLEATRKHDSSGVTRKAKTRKG
jgi:hypothetical protein